MDFSVIFGYLGYLGLDAVAPPELTLRELDRFGRRQQIRRLERIQVAYQEHGCIAIIIVIIIIVIII